MDSFMPHGYCLSWNPQLLLLFIIGNSLVTLSYYSIPTALIVLLVKRRDLVFNWMFLLFAAFIFACGTTHLVKIWTIWHASYWLEGGLDAFTGVLSAFTAVLLWTLLPKVIALPSLSQMLAANSALNEQIAKREKAEQLFRGFLESAPDAIIIVNEQGKMVQANLQAERIFGYSKSELLDHQVEMLIPERFQASHPEHRADFFKAPQARAMGTGVELFAVRKDGSEFPVEISLSPIQTEEGVLVSSAVRDISERKNQQDELKRSEQKIRSILDKSYNAFIAIDSRGAITDWNHQAEVTFGWSRQEAIGQLLTDTIIPAQYREQHNLGIANFHASGEGTVLNKRVELTSLRRDGSEFPVELTVFPVQVGSDYSFCAFVADITERKAVMKQLQDQKAELARSNNELQRFAYVAAHDLREPLRTIVSYTNLLAEEHSGKLSADAEENMAFIVDAGKRMQHLISDLLTYSRIDTQAKPFALTDCNNVFDQTVASMKIAIEEGNGQITRDSLPTVMADASQFSQLLLNLLSNALKFRSEESPQIHVTCRREDRDHWLFSVKDNGIGIDAKFSDRVFQMFQRLHGMTEYSGTGIGLAVSKRIVERHGGQIWYESNSGHGTVFFFTLPAVRETSAEEASRS